MHEKNKLILDQVTLDMIRQHEKYIVLIYYFCLERPSLDLLGT